MAEEFVPDENVMARWYVCIPLTHNLVPGDDLDEVKYIPKKEALRTVYHKAVALWPREVVDYFSK